MPCPSRLPSLGVVAAAALAILVAPERAHAHCQVPCGIYDEDLRVRAMAEDVTTITKAMRAITALAGKADGPSLNQAARWVATKEQHADRIMRTIADYFMAQRIKDPGAKDPRGHAAYLDMLADHHRVLVLAMVTKQTVDPADAEALGAAVEALRKHWHRHE